MVFMQLRIYNLLLPFLLLHLNVNLIESSTDVWKVGESDSHARTLSNTQCLLLIKDIHFETHHAAELNCLFPHDKFPKIIKDMPQWLKRMLDNDEISSNRDFLELSEVHLVSETEISIPPEVAMSSIIKSNISNRRLVSSSGTMSLIENLTPSPNSSPTADDKCS